MCSYVVWAHRPKFLPMSEHKQQLAELRLTSAEKTRKACKDLARKHEDELDEQRTDARAARLKLERELTAPRPAPVAPPAQTVSMSAPVAHAQAHMHMSMQPQQQFRPPINYQRQQFRDPNSDLHRMIAQLRGY